MNAVPNGLNTGKSAIRPVKTNCIKICGDSIIEVSPAIYAGLVLNISIYFRTEKGYLFFCNIMTSKIYQSLS